MLRFKSNEFFKDNDISEKNLSHTKTIVETKESAILTSFLTKIYITFSSKLRKQKGKEK